MPNRYAACFQVFRKGDERKLLVFASHDHKDTLAAYRFGGTGGPRIPLARVAALSTTHAAYLALLDDARSLAGVADGRRVREPLVRTGLAEGRIAELGTPDGVDAEKLLACRANAVLDHPFGRGARQRAAIGVPTIEVAEYLEEHPLGRAEWLRFFGVLLGLEARADSLFQGIEQRYIEAARSVVADRPRPHVFFGSAWQGQWHAPPGNSCMARLIMDAGGEYALAHATGNGNIALDLEQVLHEAAQADFFGAVVADGRQVDEMRLAGDERIAGLPGWRERAFCMDSERSDVFGRALLEPDVVLHELACIFQHRACPAAPRYVLRPGQ
jgi:iron complex transport system substrate-binding protein